MHHNENDHVWHIVSEARVLVVRVVHLSAWYPSWTQKLLVSGVGWVGWFGDIIDCLEHERNRYHEDQIVEVELPRIPQGAGRSIGRLAAIGTFRELQVVLR
jgi:hypothetical protein